MRLRTLIGPWGWSALVACRGPQAEQPVLPPRLAAEAACASDVPRIAVALPARTARDPFRLMPEAHMFARVGTYMQPVLSVCDLPEHVLAIGAEQTVDGGKRRIGGAVWSIARGPLAPPVGSVPIDASSTGCVAGAMHCKWRTSSPSITEIETIAKQRLPTSGWVHGLDDLCRALPDDAIAFCSTATRMAYVEHGCGDLHVGVHDRSLPRAFDLDVEVPVVRIVGRALPHDEHRFAYRFPPVATGQGAGHGAELSFDLERPQAQLVYDGVREPCVAFGIATR